MAKANKLIPSAPKGLFGKKEIVAMLIAIPPTIGATVLSNPLLVVILHSITFSTIIYVCIVHDGRILWRLIAGTVISICYIAIVWSAYQPQPNMLPVTILAPKPSIPAIKTILGSSAPPVYTEDEDIERNIVMNKSPEDIRDKGGFWGYQHNELKLASVRYADAENAQPGIVLKSTQIPYYAYALIKYGEQINDSEKIAEGEKYLAGIPTTIDYAIKIKSGDLSNQSAIESLRHGLVEIDGKLNDKNEDSIIMAVIEEINKLEPSAAK